MLHSKVFITFIVKFMKKFFKKVPTIEPDKSITTFNNNENHNVEFSTL